MSAGLYVFHEVKNHICFVDECFPVLAIGVKWFLSELIKLALLKLGQIAACGMI